MATRLQLKAAVAAVIAAATVIINKAQDDGYATAREYEADANAVRTDIAALLPQLNTEWGAQAWPTVSALRELAARLEDLRAAISEARATVEVSVERWTSLLELAVDRYGDASRWPELVALNRDLRHPGFIAPGTTVVMHAR